MDQNVHIPSAEIPENYDFRRYDQVWQRVAPGLEPYPTDKRQDNPAPASTEQTDSLSHSLPDDLQTQGSLLLSSSTVTPRDIPAASPGAAQALHTSSFAAQSNHSAVKHSTPAQSAQNPNPVQNGNSASTALSPIENGSESRLPSETDLPGAEINPCCMGSTAAEMLNVLTGFIELETSDRRYYLALAQKAPTWARGRLKDMATELANRVKRLAAVYYLITGSCYQSAISCEKIYIGRWCPALRERYHASACTGLNYARAADETTDICLARLFREFSEDAYRHADELLAMLERSMNR